ncbi:putative receptor-like protein kinase [Capsicum baccatum]|uniref:Receptor-like protein kinase n=1 Tax=Capsicum baccatum TaxID=33114 RepID=A0A2G2V7S4_CAPBA|nr:putative receptor-like protein kinase [Capsicum baccatum]
MEDKKAYSIAVTLVFLLITVLVIARTTLKFSKTFFLIFGADIALIVGVFASVLVRWKFSSRKQLLEKRSADSDGRELRIEYSFLRKVAGVPTRFKLKEIEQATDNFGALVGRGSSASVFKGVLSDGAAVAVKRIEGEERGDKEFKSEVAAIASVQHVNLVRLLGYCSVVPSGPRFLVYEYIFNGSLDKWIFRRRGIRGCLSLDLRCRVAVDVAKALSYLHHDCRSCILHLDVKPENILLDENHRAILADFGLSKLMGKDESRVVTTIRGTRGYLAPEWLLENGISEKSDVYSYGMVLLEMIGGRRNITLAEEHGKSKSKFSYFPKIVSEKLAGGKILDVVDDRLAREVAAGGGRVIEQVKRLACVALSCIQERPSRRPTMARVVEMLEARAPVEPPTQSTMMILDLLDEGLDHHPGQHRAAAAMARTGQMDTNSLRSFTMSILSGR